MRVGVVGASGYSGGELLRYLAGHPVFEVDYMAAGSNAGMPITSLHPQLQQLSGRKFEETSITRCNEMDLLFLALPHGQSASIAKELRPDVKVVDLGADFRLSDPSAWERYYGGPHAGTWVYGLPELQGARERISSSSKVANPGCYATSIIVATAPMVSAGIIDASDITVVAASGTTGAGRNPKVNILASEVMGAMTSYKFGGIHQHTPEIEERLVSVSSGSEVRISFTPILAPMSRGILATVTARTSAERLEELSSAFHGYYQNERFLQLITDGLPKTSSVVGSNNVQLSFALDHHTSRWIASVAIDNLGKGAAGQALQNANLMAGLDEGLGLSNDGLGS